MGLDNEEPSDELIETINRRHLIRTPLEPADLLFVFGTRHGVPEFVTAIAELWRGGYFRWAMVSGGSTPGGMEDEASVLSRLMIQAGVPEDVILLEREATNTGENVIFSLPILEERIGLANIGSLIAVGKLHTSARYLMTLQRHWPDVRKMLWAVNYHDHPVEAWHEHPELRAAVLREWRKIGPYKAAGFIIDLPRIPPLGRRRAATTSVRGGPRGLIRRSAGRGRRWCCCGRWRSPRAR
ncbi:YdcF family protein [Phenylobacterium sp.]|uniref:YdcF family protein n=1 Tax=Phenylobacterium sp. TaxID=1871053 RepID=UPI00273690F2|nr:YdcF family protein [Phenylobacterium sp.]MDP3852556.1 YdcF family protein [Phenylobacterium sp.]